MPSSSTLGLAYMCEAGVGWELGRRTLRARGSGTLDGVFVDEMDIFDASSYSPRVEAFIEGWNSLGIEAVTSVMHGVNVIMDAL